ncbi:hypothetical protein NDU88_004177 [Pleurodeles waltl]|uniref:Uncharacterized protein n=1 Tax=Pleurodeles waltl TaxID=8319 RepID=A0AAV7QB54_PLEWA|nr:hypothetical protein NDU88_004177 [Pleurodeles waltl]
MSCLLPSTESRAVCACGEQCVAAEEVWGSGAAYACVCEVGISRSARRARRHHLSLDQAADGAQGSKAAAACEREADVGRLALPSGWHIVLIHTVMQRVVMVCITVMQLVYMAISSCNAHFMHSS